MGSTSAFIPRFAFGPNPGPLDFTECLGKLRDLIDKVEPRTRSPQSQKLKKQALSTIAQLENESQEGAPLQEQLGAFSQILASILTLPHTDEERKIGYDACQALVKEVVKDSELEKDFQHVISETHDLDLNQKIEAIKAYILSEKWLALFTRRLPTISTRIKGSMQRFFDQLNQDAIHRVSQSNMTSGGQVGIIFMNLVSLLAEIFSVTVLKQAPTVTAGPTLESQPKPFLRI